MNTTAKGGLSRREMIKKTGTIAAASALAGLVVPHVHAGENNTIQVALVGCGGRGTGAAENALTAKAGPTKLVAMADVFQDKLDSSFKHLKNKFNDTVEVPDTRKFIGFDGYKKAIDCLKRGDVVIFTTPPAFRWVHFTYAIAKGINVFMEKPVTVDGPSTRKLLKLAEESVAKNLKVGVGLMCRHCEVRKELFDRIKSGEIGDLTFLRAYRQHGIVGSCFSEPNKDDKMSELLYQIRRFHSFLWASGGCYSDFLIHNIDECCWMKDAWPVKAQGGGGRSHRGKNVDQNFDTYSIEYTFADGAKLFLEGRCIEGCDYEFASYAHGTKGSAVISTNSHTPAKCRTFRSQKMSKGEETWRCRKDEPNPYDLEWEHLLTAIREDKPYNEAKRGAEASLVTSMGRMAAHTGKIVTFEEALNHDHEFAPEVDQLTMDSSPPLKIGADGKYPVPNPGHKGKREF